MEKISIRETVKTPSKAIEFMVEGIRNQMKRKDFIIDMGTFGAIEKLGDEMVCFGCAATCTIQEIAHKNLNKQTIEWAEDRAKYLGFDRDELDTFESAIDSFRSGNLYPLLNFFEIEWNEFPEYEKKFLRVIDKSLPTLYTDDFEIQLGMYLPIIAQLKEKGY